MSEETRSARVIAFYLPQHHPIPLRVPETRQAQADMAREYGVEAFCYWHYWFAGRRIIERPFNEVLKSGKPDFPLRSRRAGATARGAALPSGVYSAVQMPQPVNLGDLLDRSRPAGTTALIDCLDWERPREYSHGEIDRLATACARGLLARDLTRGDAVGILAGNRAEFLVAFFGTMRAGLVSVPVNHKFPRETIDFVMRDAGAKFVFCDRERRAHVPVGDGFETFLGRGEFAAVVPAARETAKPQGPRN